MLFIVGSHPSHCDPSLSILCSTTTITICYAFCYWPEYWWIFRAWLVVYPILPTAPGKAPIFLKMVQWPRKQPRKEPSTSPTIYHFHSGIKTKKSVAGLEPWTDMILLWTLNRWAKGAKWLFKKRLRHCGVAKSCSTCCKTWWLINPWNILSNKLPFRPLYSKKKKRS